MAIQQIDLAVPNGDTVRSANVKINENFSNTTHAASRLVGQGKGNLTLAEDLYKVAHSRGNITAITTGDLNDTTTVGRYSVIDSTPNAPDRKFWVVEVFDSVHIASSSVSQMAYGRNGNQGVAYRQRTGAEWTPWAVFYTTANTKLDTNGAIAPSSPTIDLYSDRIETNDDGERMNPEFVRNGVGDYTIKNTTGLRDEGWYIKIPNDMNGNPKVAVAIDTDKDGNLNIKTYKRTFSLETFTFGPDLDEPLDIPEGRWIDLRFNDLPEEELNEPFE